MILLICFACCASYLIGSLPFGLWIGLAWKGVDIRTLGSKNIGATNVLRVLGPGPAAVVFVLDTLKGALAIIVFIDLLLPGAAVPFLYRVLIGLCAILGHTFSPFLRFKGGKGVATSLGALLALNPLVATVALIAWGLVLAFSRYVSLASLVAAWTLPFAAFNIAPPSDQRWLVGLGLGLAILVTVKHRSNIARLLSGTESKIGKRVETPAESAEVR